MDILAFFAALLDLGSLSGGRVTVKERYEMKKKIRELQKQERAAQARKRQA